MGRISKIYFSRNEQNISEITFSVGSFNIRNGKAFDGFNSWWFRRQTTKKAIENIDCDILGIQEAYRFQKNWLAKQLEQYAHVGLGRNGGNKGEHCPIYYRTENVTSIVSETRWFGDTPGVPSKLPGAGFPRIYTKLHCRINNAEMDVFNTHLDERSDDYRQKSMVQLVEQIDPHIPTIVLGDFNAKRGDVALEPIEDILEYAHDVGSGTTTNSFSDHSVQPAIDHIFVSHHFTVIEAKVLREKCRGRFPSDHWPIKAVVSLKDSQ